MKPGSFDKPPDAGADTGIARWVVSVDPHPANTRAEQSQGDAQGGGLACAVVADEAVAVARAQMQRDVIQSYQRSESLG